MKNINKNSINTADSSELNLLRMTQALEGALGMRLLCRPLDALSYSSPEAATRQEEKFRALTTDTVYSCFLDYDNVPREKMSALFRRERDMLSRRGLIKRREQFLKTLSTALIFEQGEHLNRYFSQLASVSRYGRGSVHVNNIQLPGGRLGQIKDYLLYRSAEAIYEALLLPLSMPLNEYYALWCTMHEADIIRDGRIRHEHIIDIMALLLVLSLNLYEPSSKEHGRICTIAKEYIFECAKKAKDAEEVGQLYSREEAHKILEQFILSAERKIKLGGQISSRELSESLKEAEGAMHTSEPVLDKQPLQ